MKYIAERNQKYLYIHKRIKLSIYVVLLFFIIPVVSCSYSSKSLLRSNVRSIYIPIFENNTFRRGYEFDITKAVRDQILLQLTTGIIKNNKTTYIDNFMRL